MPTFDFSLDRRDSFQDRSGIQQQRVIWGERLKARDWLTYVIRTEIE
jgi:hypothetical protein